MRSGEMTDQEAAAWTRGHAVGERELKVAEKRWQVERAELRAEVERLRAELEYSVSQNEHDMLLTGEECRAARAALTKEKA
jgi:uncharacterized small protein (DUF1192 family)